MLRKILLTLCASAMLGATGLATAAAFPFGPPPMPGLGGPPRLSPGGPLPHLGPSGPLPRAGLAGPAPHGGFAAPRGGFAGTRGVAAGNLHAGQRGYASGQAARYANGYAGRYGNGYRNWGRHGAVVSGSDSYGSSSSGSGCASYSENSQRVVVCEQTE
jgi:hypothetical protein